MDNALPPVGDLLLDLLSAPAGRTLSVKALCHAGQILDLPENAVRVALTRLVQQQKIEKVGRGAYVLHPSRLPLIRDVSAWRARLGQMKPWNADWIAVSDPELPAVARTTKRRHERALSLGGFRTWKPGLHLRPNNLDGGMDALHERLRTLGLADGAEMLHLHPLSDLQRIEVIRTWKVSELAVLYTQLLNALGMSEARRPHIPVGEAARESLLLGRAVISHLARDPLLPDEIMTGGERDALIGAMDRYEQDSQRIWNTLLGLALDP